MKFCIKILLIVISITFYSNAYSNNLAYVNIEFLLENSDLGKSISQNLIKMESEKNKFLKTEEEKLRFAKELGDTKTLLIHYNNRLKSINKNIEYGFRKIG